MERDPLSNRFPLKILVVDDDYLNRVVITGMLKKLGYTPDVAEGGSQAIELFKAKDFDLVLMDCHMPKPDGYDTTRAIRSLAKQNQVVRVVGVSAAIIMGDISLCLEAGMDWAIAKPLSLNGLIEVIRSCKAATQPAARENAAIAFDRQKFLARFLGLEDLIEDLINAFNLTASDLLLNVSKAIDSKNHEALQLAAHTLSGVLANFYSSSQILAVQLEQMGREKKMENAEECFSDLVSRVEHLKKDLNVFLSERKAS